MSLNRTVINFKKLNDEAKEPLTGSEYAAGSDLFSLEEATIMPDETVFVHTGIAIEIPEGLVGLVYALSLIHIFCQNQHT